MLKIIKSAKFEYTVMLLEPAQSFSIHLFPRYSKAWTTCTQSVRSSTQTSSQRISWWVLMSLTSASSQLKPQSGRGLGRLPPLVQQVWHRRTGTDTHAITCTFMSTVLQQFVLIWYSLFSKHSTCSKTGTARLLFPFCMRHHSSV